MVRRPLVRCVRNAAAGSDRCDSTHPCVLQSSCFPLVFVLFPVLFPPRIRSAASLETQRIRCWRYVLFWVGCPRGLVCRSSGTGVPRRGVTRQTRDAAQWRQRQRFSPGERENPACNPPALNRKGNQRGESGESGEPVCCLPLSCRLPSRHKRATAVTRRR
jgi:hypothetical protein